jgi:hypothetical protein
MTGIIGRQVEADDFSRFGRSRRGSAATRQRGAGGLVLWLLLAGSALHAQSDSDGASFDRPGLGYSPQVLPAAGLAWEQGLPDWSRSHDQGVNYSTYTADSLLRLGLGHALELQLGGSPYNWQRQSGAQNLRSDGHGDSTLGLKWALPSPSASWQWGMLGSVEFTDGAQNFRSDRRVYLLGLDANQQLDDDNALGYYAQWERSGGADDYLLSASYSRSLGEQFGVYAEAAWEQQTGFGIGTAAGAGLIWQPSPRLQLDASFRHRLSGRADEWDAGLGISMYFGRL